jgi:hypothetical protein
MMKGKPSFCWSGYLLQGLSGGVIAAMAFCAFLLSTGAHGDEPKPVWLTSVDFTFSLNVREKLMLSPTYKAKYVVKTADGRTFVAERQGKEDQGDHSKVIFPNDFREDRLGMNAWAACDGAEYFWEIYANGKFIEGGSFVCGRGKRSKQQGPRGK